MKTEFMGLWLKTNFYLIEMKEKLMVITILSIKLK